MLTQLASRHLEGCHIWTFEYCRSTKVHCKNGEFI